MSILLCTPISWPCLEEASGFSTSASPCRTEDAEIVGVRCLHGIFRRHTLKWVHNSEPNVNYELPVRRDEPVSDLNLGVPAFTLGKIYRRKTELHEPFGGSGQSGISPSAHFLVVFLFTGDSGEQYGYKDHFDEDGTFFFTGEGQRGDMVFKRGNLAIRDHSSQGKALHLFRTVGKGKGQKYLGEFVYQDHEWVDAIDADKRTRKAIVFRLVPVARLERDELGETSEKPIGLTLEEARRRAVAAAKTDASKDGKQGHRMLYERSRAVRDYVLQRAAGVCELCEQPAPFLRKGGGPYLEPHHTTRVSDGGPDHPQFVAALCPTCHREVHYGEYAQARNTGLIEKLQKIEQGGNR